MFSVKAAGVGDIIYEGSGKMIDLSPSDMQAPILTGNNGEEKVDRGTLTIINVILYICGTAAGIMILVGGIRYAISSGDEDMVKGAKSTILWAMGGLVMTFLAWAIVLNVVRVGTLDERIDYSENPTGGQCGPNVTMGCKDKCCGCGALGTKISSCNDGLVCGGPLDVSGVKVCQPKPEAAKTPAK